MTRDEVKIGSRFTCGDQTWQVTDIGQRVVVAILVCERMAGPPYEVSETVFDEYDLPACEVEG